MKWFAKAPSNIALIKYMGKSNKETNTPTNSSISYTLNNLQSFVEIELADNITTDIWHPLDMENCPKLLLNEFASNKFLKHFSLIKKKYNIQDNFIVRSCNNFPHATGLASSASSFAALTKCSIQAMSDLSGKTLPSNSEMAQISKLGSGSSCRSFFSPWALWSADSVSSIELPYTDLTHRTIIVSDIPKKISSSDAHNLVQTSPFFNKRIENMEQKVNQLIISMRNHDWSNMYQIVKEEFLDMHNLFMTADKPFSFMTETSKKIIDDIESWWNTNEDGPLITMDAGPNIHLLFRQDQTKLSEEMHKYISTKYATK